MNFWLTSDLHFGHVNIIRFCDRPFSDVVEMNTALVARWNAQVNPEDHVWVIGDLCMGHLDDSLRYVSMLNGTIHLIPGNHDPVWSAGPEKRRDKWWDRYADLVRIHPEIMPYREVVTDVHLCHFPRRNRSGEYDDRYIEHHPEVGDDDWMVHGHVHDLWRQRGRDINVGIDAWGGRLVNYDEVAALMDAGPNDLESIPWPR